MAKIVEHIERIMQDVKIEPSNIAAVELVKLRLVPVEVFGAGRCPVHSSDADGNNPTLCSECKEPVEGYGLCDAVSAWSDCNRAVGQIYRVDDCDPQYRNDSETIEILVPRDKLDWFKKKWADD